LIESVLIILPLAAIVVVAFILLSTRLILLLGLCFRVSYRKTRPLSSLLQANE
jgi:hypothetical protein